MTSLTDLIRERRRRQDDRDRIVAIFHVFIDPATKQEGDVPCQASVVGGNDMQECLGELYAAVSADAKMEKWRELRNDRSQRDLLTGAAKQLKAINGKADASAIKRVQAEISWLVDQADRLADHRNNFVHAPFFYAVEEDGSVTAKPIDLFGNPRGAALAGTDLIKGTRAYRDDMVRPRASGAGTVSFLANLRLRGRRSRTN